MVFVSQGACVSGRPPWLYLDADGFFASCEEAADPRLHGRPVGVVAGSAYADAPLIAVNTSAFRHHREPKCSRHLFHAGAYNDSR